MRYVLTRSKQETFCTSIINNVESEDQEIIAMVEGCKNYYFEVYGNTYFLSKDIERRVKSENIDNKYISSVFAIIDEVNFYIETFNNEFVEFLIQTPSKKEYELDEEISEIHESYLNRYGY